MKLHEQRLASNHQLMANLSHTCRRQKAAAETLSNTLSERSGSY